MTTRRLTFGAVCAACVLSVALYAQQQTTPVTVAPPYPLIAISATAAVNVVSTLTIPTPPPGWYNYVCGLHFNASQDGTATAITHGVTSSTNFNSFAIKYSLVQTVRANYDWYENWSQAGVCIKSASPATATTFVSAQSANTAFTWSGTYFQGP